MKLLKKINKGVVLTIIVIVALVIYLVGVEAKRSEEKPNIERTAKEYIELIDRYAVLPEEYQQLSSKRKEEEAYELLDEALSKQLDNFEEELKKVMIDNKTAIELQKDSLDMILNSTNDLKDKVVTKYDREIKKIKKYEFDDNQVTITFDSEINYETKYLENRKAKTQKNSQKAEDESITLVYEDEMWKVVYANLRTDSNTNAGMFGIF